MVNRAYETCRQSNYVCADESKVIEIFGPTPLSHQIVTSYMDGPLLNCRYVPPFKLTGGSAPEAGFTLVGETGGPVNAGLISAGLRMTADLFDMLSNNGGGDIGEP